MGMVGRAIAAIVQAIRRVVWELVNGVLVPVAKVVDAAAMGLIRGAVEAFRRTPIETEEVVSDPRQEIADAKAAEALVEAEMKAWTPGRRVLEACELRREGKRWEHLFDRTDEAQADLFRWVRRLDETALQRVRAVHHTALTRHLDPSNAGRLDLPAPEAIRRRAALVAADREAEVEREKAASPAREAALKIAKEAKRRGRKITLADAVPTVGMRL